MIIPEIERRIMREYPDSDFTKNKLKQIEAWKAMREFDRIIYVYIEPILIFLSRFLNEKKKTSAAKSSEC